MPGRERRAAWPRRLAGSLLLLMLCTAAAAPPSSPAAPATATTAWTGTWSTALYSAGPATRMADATLRQIAHVSVGGRQLRLRLSNEYGTAPLRIGGVRVGLAAPGGAVQPGTERVLRFSGDEAVLIGTGGAVHSDPLAFDLPAFADLAITLYLPPQEAGEITYHGSARQTTYLAVGRHVDRPTLPDASKQTSTYIVSAVEVAASGQARRSVVAFGDSITDGYNLADDTQRRWPDLLAQRLAAAAGTADTGVLNLSIGGGQLLGGRNVPSGVQRFEREVLAHSGVSHVIVFIGINDIGVYGRPHLPSEEVSADDLISGYRRLIALAHARGISVLGGTIAPYRGAGYYSERGEALRQAINQWIRQGGEFDGVVDFDAALDDPANPGALAPALDGGDRLHPGDAGRKAMADAVDLRLVQRRR